MLLLSHVRLLSGKPKMVNMVNLCVFFFFFTTIRKNKADTDMVKHVICQTTKSQNFKMKDAAN